MMKKKSFKGPKPVSRKRIIFLGTPEFAKEHLDFLIQSEKFEVCGVLTQPDRRSGRKLQLKKSPVKQLAEKNGIECLSPSKVTEEGIFEKIKDWGAEAAVVVAFGQILPQSFLDLFPQKVVNIHGSLLPRWRGAAPIQRAIMAGDEFTGVSLQIMVKKLDAGDIIGERKINIRPDMGAVELHDHLKVLGTDLLDIEFYKLLTGPLPQTVQDESLVTYAHKLDKAESLIDWSKSSTENLRKLLGMSLGPGVYSFLKSKKLKIIKAKNISELNGAAGEVLQVEKDHFVVACGEGALQVLEVQPESKPKMPVQSFLQGNALKKGDKLGE